MRKTLAERPQDTVLSVDGTGVVLDAIVQLLKHGNDPDAIDAARRLALVARRGAVATSDLAPGAPQAEAHPSELEQSIPQAPQPAPTTTAASTQAESEHRPLKRPALSHGGAVAEIVVHNASTSISMEEAATKANNTDPRPSGLRRAVIFTGAAATALSSVGVGAVFATRPESVPAGEAACADGKGGQGDTVMLIRTGASEGPRKTWRDDVRSMLEKFVPGVRNVNTWSEVAAYVSKKQGYDVSAEQLAALNRDGAMNAHDGQSVDVAEYVDGRLQDELYHIGPTCFKIPGPTVAGQVKTTDKMDTLTMVAKTYGITTQKLRALNPGLPPNDDEPLGPGNVIQVSEKLDTDLVLQKVDGAGIDEFVDYNDPTKAAVQVKKLLAANKNFNSHVQSGRLHGLLYLPLHRKVAATLAKTSPEGKITIVPTQNTYAKKPEAPKEQAPQAIALSLEERKKLIEGMNLSPEQKVQLTKFVETLAAMPEGELKGVRTDVVLAQAIISSKWGTSEAAKYNNFFGLKANKDWKGKTVKVAINDARRDQDLRTVEYRAYDSMADAFRDYVAAIRNSTDFKTHGNDAFVDQAALADLYGGEVLDFRTELLFQLLMSAKFGDKRFEDYHVAGGIGGFIVESGHTLSATKKENISPERLAELGRKAAEGIGQWQEGRAVDRKVHQEKHGVSTTSDGEFVIHELQHKEKIRLPHILEAKDTESSTIAWRVHYERPSVPHDDRRIDAANYAMAVHARAQAHGAKIKKTTSAYQLAKLSGYVPSVRPAASAPKPAKHEVQATGERPSQFTVHYTENGKQKTVVIKSTGGPIKLNPLAYDRQQCFIQTNRQPHAKVNVGGVMVPSAALETRKYPSQDYPNTSKNDRVYSPRDMLIENQLNAIRLSPEGYQKFLERRVDLTDTVPKKYPNFSGRKRGFPDIKRDTKFYIWHVTFTGNNDRDGDAQASSMQNAGDGLAVQKYVNSEGTLYELTKANVPHTLPWNPKKHPERDYHRTAIGNEFAAADMSGVLAPQYQAGIYDSFKFLSENGFITKDKPAGPVIDRMIQGHAERNPWWGAHSDFGKMIMDQVRIKIKEFAAQMGYRIE